MPNKRLKIGDIVYLKSSNNRIGIVAELGKPHNDRMLVDYAMSGWNNGHNGSKSYRAKLSKSCWWNLESDIELYDDNNNDKILSLIIE